MQSKKEIKILENCQQKHDNNKTKLRQNTTWIKYNLILYSIYKTQSRINDITSAQHQKKHDALIVNKRIITGIKKNPYNVITNLSTFKLTEDEIEVLNFGLKHGVLTRPKESEMVATMEYVWEQIDNHNILKENHMTKHRVQTALRAFTYNYLDLESKDYYLDRKRVNIIKNIREKVMILKPDKIILKSTLWFLSYTENN